MAYPGIEFRDFVPLAGRFVEAAAAGDTATLLSLSCTDQPVPWALYYRASEPQLFTQAAGQLKVQSGGRLGETACCRATMVYVEFSFPYEGGGERLGIMFARLGETWKITSVQLSGRF
jgi:hypothetical protein